MAYRKITKNRLITSLLKTEQDEIQPISLLGLINIEEKEDPEIEGWFLLITGDPLIPLEAGEKPQNKIAINRLYLTSDQEKKISKNSYIQDGYAYLYAGMFKIQNLEESEDLSWEWISSNILNILSSHMSRNILKLNFDTNVILKEKDIIRRVVIPEKEISTGGNPQNFEDFDEKKETLRFNCAGNQVLVELQCPIDHKGYHVEIIFFETLIYLRGEDEDKQKRTTRLVTEADVQIPPCLITQGPENTTVDGDNISGKRATITVKKFQMPVYSKDWEKKFVDEHNVCCVEFRGIAHLIRDEDLEEVTVEKLVVKKFPRKVVATPKIKKKLTFSSASSEQSLENKSVDDTSLVNSDTGAVYPNSSFDKCPNCKVSSNVVVMEVELKPGKRDVERAFSF